MNNADPRVEWGMRIWDFGAVQIMIEEVGGACLWVEKPKDWSTGKYSAVIGKPTLVKRIYDVVR